VWLAPGSTAHARLEWTRPADRAAVDEPPGRIVMGWLGPIDIEHARVEVVDPTGVSHQTSDPSYGGNGAIVVSADGRGPGGAWLIRYAMPGLDGHVSRGSFGFHVAHAASVAPGSRRGLYAGLGGIAVLLLVLGVLGRRSRRGAAAA
jgi:methionine-rich copper-binding protein CopC